MRNTVFALIGVWVMLIGIVCVMTLSERGIRRMQLENNVSRSMKEAFVICYDEREKKGTKGETLSLWKTFEGQMKNYPSGRGHYKMKKIKEDFEKGILSVIVEEHYQVKKGVIKVITVKRTMIKEN